nr:E3 ubiquitin-protein ligase RMA3-like [Ipomoea batatas]
MAFEQGFREPIMHSGSDGDVSLKQKKDATSVPKMVSEDAKSYFDCNICLDPAHDPVVTFCGHLYCWPCIYKWLEVQSSSSESAEQPKCPVCKASISKSTFVPLYGHDLSSSDSDSKKFQLDLPIPQRPPALGVDMLLNTSAPNSILNPQLQSNHFHPRPPPSLYHQQYFPHTFGSYASTAPGFFSPTIGMFGEMFSARTSGSMDTTLFAYPNSNGTTPRMRRQEMQVDKSLNRLYIFLLCCLLVCLLLF